MKNTYLGLLFLCVLYIKGFLAQHAFDFNLPTCPNYRRCESGCVLKGHAGGFCYNTQCICYYVIIDDLFILTRKSVVPVIDHFRLVGNPYYTALQSGGAYSELRKAAADASSLDPSSGLDAENPSSIEDENYFGNYEEGSQQIANTGFGQIAQTFNNEGFSPIAQNMDQSSAQNMDQSSAQNIDQSFSPIARRYSGPTRQKRMPTYGPSGYYGPYAPHDYADYGAYMARDYAPQVDYLVYPQKPPNEIYPRNDGRKPNPQYDYGYPGYGYNYDYYPAKIGYDAYGPRNYPSYGDYGGLQGIGTMAASSSSEAESLKQTEKGRNVTQVVKKNEELMETFLDPGPGLFGSSPKINMKTGKVSGLALQNQTGMERQTSIARTKSDARATGNSTAISGATAMSNDNMFSSNIPMASQATQKLGWNLNYGTAAGNFANNLAQSSNTAIGFAMKNGQSSSQNENLGISPSVNGYPPFNAVSSGAYLQQQASSATKDYNRPKLASKSSVVGNYFSPSGLYPESYGNNLLGTYGDGSAASFDQRQASNKKEAYSKGKSSSKSSSGSGISGIAGGLYPEYGSYIPRSQGGSSDYYFDQRQAAAEKEAYSKAKSSSQLSSGSGTSGIAGGLYQDYGSFLPGGSFANYFDQLQAAVEKAYSKEKLSTNSSTESGTSGIAGDLYPDNKSYLPVISVATSDNFFGQRQITHENETYSNAISSSKSSSGSGTSGIAGGLYPEYGSSLRGSQGGSSDYSFGQRQAAAKEKAYSKDKSSSKSSSGSGISGIASDLYPDYGSYLPGSKDGGYAYSFDQRQAAGKSNSASKSSGSGISAIGGSLYTDYGRYLPGQYGGGSAAAFDQRPVSEKKAYSKAKPASKSSVSGTSSFASGLYQQFLSNLPQLYGNASATSLDQRKASTEREAYSNENSAGESSSGAQQYGGGFSSSYGSTIPNGASAEAAGDEQEASSENGDFSKSKSASESSSGVRDNASYLSPYGKYQPHESAGGYDEKEADNVINDDYDNNYDTDDDDSVRSKAGSQASVAARKLGSGGGPYPSYSSYLPETAGAYDQQKSFAEQQAYSKSKSASQSSSGAGKFGLAGRYYPSYGSYLPSGSGFAGAYQNQMASSQREARNKSKSAGQSFSSAGNNGVLADYPAYRGPSGSGFAGAYQNQIASSQREARSNSKSAGQSFSSAGNNGVLADYPAYGGLSGGSFAGAYQNQMASSQREARSKSKSASQSVSSAGNNGVLADYPAYGGNGAGVYKQQQKFAAKEAYKKAKSSSQASSGFGKFGGAGTLYPYGVNGGMGAYDTRQSSAFQESGIKNKDRSFSAKGTYKGVGVQSPHTMFMPFKPLKPLNIPLPNDDPQVIAVTKNKEAKAVTYPSDAIEANTDQ